MREVIATNWHLIALGLVAIYVLHLYRLGRLTQPPAEARGNFWTSLGGWIRIHSFKLFGAIGAILGGFFTLTQLGGWSILALGNLDPVVLLDFVVLSYVGAEIAGLNLPTFAWFAIGIGVVAIGVRFGGFWKNRNNR